MTCGVCGEGTHDALITCGRCMDSGRTDEYERGRRSRDAEVEALHERRELDARPPAPLASDPAALDVIQRTLSRSLAGNVGDPLRKWGDRAEWSARTAMQLAEEIDKLRGAK